MHKNSVIEINQEAHKRNIDFLQKVFGKKVMLSSVVKGNAYGHGLAEFVQMAFDNGIQHFSVFDVEEAKIVFDTLQNKVTILIMGFVADDDIEWVIQNQIEFFVFERYRLARAAKVAKRLQQKAILHIEVETGMHRTGFEMKNIARVAQFLVKEQKNIKFKGLCTHYAGAESISNYYRIATQIEKFNQAETIIKSYGITPEIKHSACSAAAMMFPETRMDLVRIGILQYGLWPSPEVFVTYLNTKKVKKDPLCRVISWKTEIMSIKRIKAGDFVGYGTSFMATDAMKIATIPLGYAHGYSRSLSNHGQVLVNGQRCRVIGTVNMNMLTVDVTEIDHVKKGDEVVLIGYQKESVITIASFSDYSNQLNYELLTRIAKTIPRKII
ncbi:alanine racemase [Flavobacterium sp. J27]|uniref:alanine racemase n=1 Tax=Flavobacterium sp. J27 TaxID=2060419 RepID=UPI001030AC07|nr:alanine racemase [Flavobacterium sp. J27]